MCYPRVLVISNNSFSLSNSNGRTLGLLFKGWPKDKLCQMCITSDGPDWDVCDNYFCASDRQVLKSTMSFMSVKRNDLTTYEAGDNPDAKRIKRTAIKSLIRHFMWQIGIWRKGEFDKWVKAFSPEIVMIQSGDTAFTHDLARKICVDYHAKMVFFNTEGVYFQNKNYLYKGFCDFFFFPIYNHLYRHSYRKAMNMASYAFYLNGLIQKDNDSFFDVPSCVIYNTTSIKECVANMGINNTKPVISYFGNMGYDRSKVLVEVANLLKEMNIGGEFNVYGKGFPEAIKRLEECDGLIFHGFLPYSKIQDVIRHSDILLHVESQEPKHAEGLRYGFSTKIADCLASGRPFLLYSSMNIACAQYLVENDCAWCADTPDKFKEAVRIILFNANERERKLNNAHNIAMKNHDIDVNSAKFQKQLLSLR